MNPSVSSSFTGLIQEHMARTSFQPSDPVDDLKAQLMSMTDELKLAYEPPDPGFNLDYSNLY